MLSERPRDNIAGKAGIVVRNRLGYHPAKSRRAHNDHSETLIARLIALVRVDGKLRNKAALTLVKHMSAR